MASAERIEFAKNNNLCNICLNNHKGKCKFHFRCTHCNKGHNSLLHPNDQDPVTLFSNICNNVLLPTVRIKLFSKDNREVHVKAILDTGSQASLVTTKVVDLLDLAPTQSNVNIVGVTNAINHIKYSIPLEVHSLTSEFRTLINFQVVEKITCKLPQKPINITKLKIPPGLKLADSTFNIPSEINTLLGADIFFRVVLPQIPVYDTPQQEKNQSLSAGQNEDPSSSPSIYNTKFGYIIGGALPAFDNNSKVSLLCHTCESDIGEVNATIKQFWECEEVPQIMNEISSESQTAESIFLKSVKLENNKFQVDLPLKVSLNEISNTLGNSFDVALFRFLSLEKRLHKNVSLFNDYKKFIDEYVDLNHGHYVDIKSYNFSKDPIYLLLHHPVVNEASKSTPVRVVFNGSMPTNKKLSLNDILLNGPTVQNSLFDILLLFRFGDYIFTTDIRRMFRNIEINPAYKPLQNILWRENTQQPIQCICLDTVTYGLKNSSYLATRCLLELAVRFEAEYPIASFILKQCTYVDDILFSHSNLEVLKEAKKQLCDLLKLASLETHKWASNNANILCDIPDEKQQLENLDFRKDCNFNIKILGLNFDLKMTLLQFPVQITLYVKK
ncbi:hypothetical protein K1T71_010277 [Dendrolimus kikuchii]|uniref:Uncharacterized protein n=1 Tax=Dendrolimus kikuchii TaxID=765133 RepID=A0ACC1CRA9_9NEOP|nr:hypothetical protein K1T71_010277 [Dendrolimus kikuchii]